MATRDLGTELEGDRLARAVCDAYADPRTSIRKLATAFGRPKSHIRRILTDRGIRIRTRAEQIANSRRIDPSRLPLTELYERHRQGESIRTLAAQHYVSHTYLAGQLRTIGPLNPSSRPPRSSRAA